MRSSSIRGDIDDILRKPGDGGEPPEDVPELRVIITSPKNGSRPTEPANGQELVVRVTVSAFLCTVQSVTVGIGDWASGNAHPVTEDTWTFSGRVEREGELMITVTANGTNDNSGTSMTDSKSVKVIIEDSVPPQLSDIQVISGRDRARGPIALIGTDNSIIVKGYAKDYLGLQKIEIRPSFATKEEDKVVIIDLNHNLDYYWESRPINIDFRWIGEQTIAVTCYDLRNNRVDQTVNFTTLDITSPVCEIYEPREGKVIENTGNGGNLRIEGTAIDAQTGVSVVECYLITGDNTDNPDALGLKLTPHNETKGDWSYWRFDAANVTDGRYTVKIIATDNKKNNNAPVFRKIEVARIYKPQDISDLLSPRAYLEDLLLFASDHVTTPDGPLKAKMLESAFCQPFDKLEDPFQSIDPSTHWANQQVNQLRIYVEILHRYMVQSSSFDLKENRSSYCLEAYRAILNAIGTSYDEIRLTHSADEATRKSLAARLGIELDSRSPDQLDEMFMQPDQITEAKLEDLFGLADTTKDPWNHTGEKPKLLKWQLTNLRTIWYQEDYSTIDNEMSSPPIIDPDIIQKDDLGKAGDVVSSLWQDRFNWLNVQFNTLKTLRESTGEPLEGLKKIISEAITVSTNHVATCQEQHDRPLDFLQCLAEQLKQGKDIEPELKVLHLTTETFMYILRLAQLAESPAKVVTSSEWQDLYHILVQVKKSQKFDEWKQAERLANITLSPDYFRISAISHELNLLRASPHDRQKWQDTLQARIDQEMSVIHTLQENIWSAEEIALPTLRDSLVTQIAGSQQNLSDTADRLTEELLIDVRGDSRQTTRIFRAIETLQTMFFSLRTGFLKNPKAEKWEITTANTIDDYFDEEWRWQGDYSLWRAAMLIFYYPQNVLFPSLRDEEYGQTEHFKAWMKNLRSTYATLRPEKARNQANEFLKGFKDSVVTEISELLSGFSLTDEDLTEQRLAVEIPSRIAKVRNKIKEVYGQSKELPWHLLHLSELFFFVPQQLALQLQKSGEYVAALNWFQTIYAYNLRVNDQDNNDRKRRKIYYGLGIEDENLPFRLSRGTQWLIDWLNPHTIAASRPNMYTHFTLQSIVRCLLEFGDIEFTHYTSESIVKAHSLYTAARRLLLSPDLQLPERKNPEDDIVLPNPVHDALLARVESQLQKIRHGRNISGMKRLIETFAPVTSINNASNDGSSVQISEQIFSPSLLSNLRPTPYKYNILIERSKQLVNISQQIEAAYLSTLEKRDKEDYDLKQAGYHLDLAKSNLDLQKMRIDEAKHGVVLAQRQKDRNLIQQNTYQSWINAGANQWEKAMLSNYKLARNYRVLATTFDATAKTAQLIVDVAQTGFGALAAAPAATLAAAAVWAGAAANTGAIIADTDAQINSVVASLERRKEEWLLQKSLAEQDLLINDQQLLLAQDHEAIATKEYLTANIQEMQAQSTAKFLATKFTNVELYDWMSGVLAGVYSYFLQQATAVAQLAQSQLAFERQEILPKFIKEDYWQSPSTSSESSIHQDGSRATSDGRGDETPDRRGLTGSARLLQDIYQLDQYAFNTDKRKLNLTQTFSLAQLDPYAFQRFRETGILPFSISMNLLDGAFPGNYMRLIKSVRTSIIALIPPSQGIRATLMDSGISRVVIEEGGSFREIEIKRDSEMVALTSPINTTGVFELDLQSDMLLPFQNKGIANSWLLEMPKAANAFDYRTIADVLFTIDYTALHSTEYRQQVIRKLNRKTGGERVFSLRDRLPDQWYKLLNPDDGGFEREGGKEEKEQQQEEQDDDNITIQLKVGREDFPVNIENLKTERIVVYFAYKDEKNPREAKVSLTKDQKPIFKNATSNKNGIISTANITLSVNLNLMSPDGEWELTLPNTQDIQNQLRKEEVEDILLVIAYVGNTPNWPS